MNPDAPRRVLFVDHVRHILAGAEINLLELSAEAAARGAWEVHAACDAEGPLFEALASRGTPCHRHGFGTRLGTLRIVGRRFPVSQALRSLKALLEARRSFAELLHRVRPSIVVSCTNKDHFAAWPACRSSRIPSIWWVNDILSPDFFPWAARRAFRQQARRGASRLVAVSEFARQALIRQDLAPDHVVAIHNGIPLDRYQRQPLGTLRRMVSAKDDEPLVGVVGRFTPWKGQDFFLRLAESWCRSSPSGQFVVVGHAFNEDQGFEWSLRDFVRSHGLRERIHLIPFQRDIARALSDLDLLVHTSTKPEPFGRVLIEAMAVGVPVLAARAGGVPEIIAHGRDGLLAEPGDLQDYRACLERVLGDSEFRRRLSLAGRETVQARFSVTRVHEAFEAVFESVRPAACAS